MIKPTIYYNKMCPFASLLPIILQETDSLHKVEQIIIPLSQEMKYAEIFGKNIEVFPWWKEKNINYDQFIQIKEDYKQAINPSGAVPTIIYLNEKVNESEVCAQFLIDLFQGFGNNLTIKDPLVKAKAGQALKHWSSNAGVFYQLVGNQDESKDEELKNQIKDIIKKWLSFFRSEGPFFNNEQITLVDLAAYPLLYRMQYALKEFRNFDFFTPELRRWFEAVGQRKSIQQWSPSKEVVLKAYRVTANASKGDYGKFTGRNP